MGRHLNSHIDQKKLDELNDSVTIEDIAKLEQLCADGKISCCVCKEKINTVFWELKIVWSEDRPDKYAHYECFYNYNC